MKYFADARLCFIIMHIIDIKLLLKQIKAIGQTELNSSNPEEVLQLAAQKRKKKFLQAMAKLYF